MKQISTDFQGWPVNAFTLKDLLQALGATLDPCGRIGFEDDDPILDMYPRVLDDDGMGYGVNERYIVEADKLSNIINIFTDIQDEQFRRTESGGNEGSEKTTLRGPSESE